jgi:hypothetical protein
LLTLLYLRLSRSTHATTAMNRRVTRLGRASGLMPAVPKFWVGFWAVSAGGSAIVLNRLLLRANESNRP